MKVKPENTQKARLLKHFQQGGEVTSLSAYMLWGVTQLGARIIELEKDGYCFNRPRVKLPTGKVVCQYSLIEITYPAQCSCGHLFLEKYQFAKPNENGEVGFCWCGFCKTKLMVKPNLQEEDKI